MVEILSLLQLQMIRLEPWVLMIDFWCGFVMIRLLRRASHAGSRPRIRCGRPVIVFFTGFVPELEISVTKFGIFDMHTPILLECHSVQYTRDVRGMIRKAVSPHLYMV